MGNLAQGLECQDLPVLLVIVDLELREFWVILVGLVLLWSRGVWRGRPARAAPEANPSAWAWSQGPRLGGPRTGGESRVIGLCLRQRGIFVFVRSLLALSFGL